MAKPKKGNGSGQLEPRVRFHYLKSTQFRVIHADGAIGGITPTGKIHVSFYSERSPIPRETVQKINPEDGSLGDIIHEETVIREGIIREMDFDVLMDIQTAKNVCKWLDDKIKQFDQDFPTQEKS